MALRMMRKGLECFKYFSRKAFSLSRLSLVMIPEQGSCYTNRNIGTSSKYGTAKPWIPLLRGQQKAPTVINCSLDTWEFETEILKLKAP